MALRFTSLGSGSSGNALVVENGSTRVMMDCGFSIAETKARLTLGLIHERVRHDPVDAWDECSKQCLKPSEQKCVRLPRH